MFWYVLIAICVVLTIIGIIMSCKSDNYDINLLGNLIAASFGIVLVILLIIIPIANISSKQSIEIFKQQKQYIESHVAKNDIEDAAITTKKIELNEWLYNAQYAKKNYSIFVFYGDEVLKLEVIN